MKLAYTPSAMFLFGRKNNASDAPAPLPPVTPAPAVPAAGLPVPPPFVPPPPVIPAPVAESAPVPTADSTPAEVPFKAPRGVSPESRRQRQRVQRLKRELRVSGRSLIRQRLTETKPLFVLGSPLPEIAPAPLPLPLPVEEVPLPFVPEIAPPEAAVTTAPVLDEAALKALVSSSPAFVEMQYELVDLRHQLQTLQQAPAPEAKVEAAAPALDESALKALVPTAPAFVELQYELVDLRHQLQAMQNELAALRASKSEAPAPMNASQLAIVDTNGQVVANISAEGVVSCSSIIFMAQR